MALTLKPSSDEEVMLTLPENQLRRFLVAEKKSDSEIDRMMNELKEKREKIEKSSNKLYSKVLAKYPNKSESELLELTLRYANKHGLTSKAQQNALWRTFIKKLKGIRDSPYLPIEKPHTEMARFLGVRGDEPPLMDVPADDRRYLEEIAALYEKYCGFGKLHDLVKSNSKIANIKKTYTDINSSKLNQGIDNKDIYIHPIIHLLYGDPQDDILEKQTLFASFARLILARSYNVMKSYVNMQYNSLYDLQQDNELVEAIAKDPSSTDFFSKQSPMANLLQRTKVQIALWENVLRLRNGEVYGKLIEQSNPMMLLSMELERYPLTIFDDLNVYSFNNPVAYLKKLLAVFSYRQVMFKYSDAGTLFTHIAQTQGPAGFKVLPSQLIQPSYGIQASIHIPYLYTEDQTKNVISILVNSAELLFDKKSPVYKKRELIDAGPRFFVTINLFLDQTFGAPVLQSSSTPIVYKPLQPTNTKIKIDPIKVGSVWNAKPVSVLKYIERENMFYLCSHEFNNIIAYCPSLGQPSPLTSLKTDEMNDDKYVSVIVYTN